MNETKLEIETFVLKGTGVMFPELFAKQHDEHLVSISANPGEAARWWHGQNDKCFPGEGWVSFMLNGGSDHADGCVDKRCRFLAGTT